MTVDERLNEYIHSLYPQNTEFLNELEKQAHKTYVPVIRKDVQNLLKLLLVQHRPEHILEVGTAIGFSAILMAEYDPVRATITTIENYEKRIPIARENFEKSGFSDRIRLLEGDARDILPVLEGSYDFVFMDAAKGQYLSFLPHILRLLSPGGLLVSDNTLQDGNVSMSRYAIEHRDRTIHTRMRNYLFELTHNENLNTVVLPIGDGVTVSIKAYEKT